MLYYFLTIITMVSNLTIQLPGMMPVITANDVAGLVQVCEAIEGTVLINKEAGAIRCLEADGDYIQLNVNENAMIIKSGDVTQAVVFTEYAPVDSDVYILGGEVYVRE